MSLCDAHCVRVTVLCSSGPWVLDILSFKLIYFFTLCLWVFGLYACQCMTYMSGDREGWKAALDLLELELQVVMWVLGIELKSSERAASGFNCSATSPALKLCFWRFVYFHCKRVSVCLDGGQKGLLDPMGLELRDGCKLPCGGLGTEPGSSGQTASALGHSATSPALRLCFES